METKPKVLVVDDEENFRTILRTMLNLNDYNVDEAETAKEALIKIKEKPDAVLLDLILPDLYGIDVMREIITKTDIPIIVVSVKDSKLDIETALNNGASDYIIKSNLKEAHLIAKLKHLIGNRNKKNHADTISLGNILIDTRRKIVKERNIRIPFTETEYKIFEMFAKNPNEIIENERIIKEIWGENYDCDENYVRGYIKKIREKIEKDASNPKILVTEHGRGYILVK